MLAFSPLTPIYVIHNSIDFRNGIEGCGAVVRELLKLDPLSGAAFAFRNRRTTSAKILFYDTQGFWLCQKRLSTGKFNAWPKSEEVMTGLQAHELMVLLWNGDFEQAKFSAPWRKFS